MAKKQLMRTPNLRIGWLEAFVATAHHLSYEGAKADAGTSATSVGRAVLKLELWLRRVLIYDDCFPFELAPEGERFLPRALEALHVLKRTTEPQFQHATERPLSLRKSKRSMIRLSDSRSLRAVMAAGSFKNAATDSGIAREVLQGDMKQLKNAFGGNMIEGRTILHLTELSERVASAFDQIEAILNDHKAQLVEHDADKQKMQRAYNVLRQRMLTNEMVVTSAVRRKQKLTNGDSIEAAREVVALQRQLLAYLEDDHGMNKGIDPNSIFISEPGE